MKRPVLDLNDYQSFVTEFHAESDRSAIIMAGSFAESYLATYLRHFMVDSKDDNSEVERLFEGGPLASFDARISLAFAFKLISREHREDLRHIKAIRNRFAHSPRTISLSREDIQEHLRELSMWKLVHAEPADSKVEKSDRHVFLFTVGMFVVFAHNQILRLKKPNSEGSAAPERTDDRTG
jgi:DNA-binding MltR family transcriptional regulator